MMRHLLLITALALVAIVTIGAVFVAALNFVNLSSSKSQTAACSMLGKNYAVYIADNKLSTTIIQGRLCDTLTITNNNARLRLIAFGPHEHHTAYDGVLEKLLDRGQSLTVVLNQTGHFTFHDHLEDSIVGYFTVTK